MTLDIDEVVREGLRATELPTAPESLHRFLQELPQHVEPVRPIHTQRFLPAVVVLATLAILMLGLGGVILTGTSLKVAESAGPSPSATPSETDGVVTFKAPGITFVIPGGWNEQAVNTSYPTPVGVRVIAAFARGLTLCPLGSVASSPPSPQAHPCETEVTVAGTAVVRIVEYEDQLPGVTPPGTATTIGPYPAWEPTTQPSCAGPTRLLWAIKAPDRGLYLVQAEMLPIDTAMVRGEVEGVLKTLQLFPWESPTPVANGRSHMDLQDGFSFDYPAGWIVYYPQDISMMDHPVVTVASRRLLPPCASDSCQRFNLPPGTIAVEFRVGNGPTAPDWSSATTTVGGQPAFRQDWGQRKEAGLDEGHQWNARLTDPSVLGIYVWLSGPNVEGLRTTMDEVVASVRITRQPSPSP